MNRARWQAGMILLGVITLVLSIIVMIRNTNRIDIELLAGVGIAGGLAMILNALPREGS
jgi:uncharacterized integral membrane protein